jgi:hypothetical protein
VPGAMSSTWDRAGNRFPGNTRQAGHPGCIAAPSDVTRDVT